MKVKLSPEHKIKVLNSDDVYGIMQKVLLRQRKIDRAKEHFWIVCLSTNNTILLIELISLGSGATAVAEPMDVFSFALQKRAAKIIMAHNHPSGELRPSKDDVELTDTMSAIGHFLKLPVIDHLIISETNYYSFENTGLLREIIKNSVIDLTFKKVGELKQRLKRKENVLKKQLARLKNEKRKLEKEKNKAVEMARKMLSKKYSLREIQELTGLTKKQVEWLKGGK